MAFFVSSMPFRFKYFLSHIIFWFKAVMVFPKIAGKWLVFDKAAGYEFISYILI